MFLSPWVPLLYDVLSLLAMITMCLTSIRVYNSPLSHRLFYKSPPDTDTLSNKEIIRLVESTNADSGTLVSVTAAERSSRYPTIR